MLVTATIFAVQRTAASKVHRQRSAAYPEMRIAPCATQSPSNETMSLLSGMTTAIEATHPDDFSFLRLSSEAAQAIDVNALLGQIPPGMTTTLQSHPRSRGARHEMKGRSRDAGQTPITFRVESDAGNRACILADRPEDEREMWERLRLRTLNDRKRTG